MELSTTITSHDFVIILGKMNINDVLKIYNYMTSGNSFVVHSSNDVMINISKMYYELYCSDELNEVKFMEVLKRFFPPNFRVYQKLKNNKLI